MDVDVSRFLEDGVVDDVDLGAELGDPGPQVLLHPELDDHHLRAGDPSPRLRLLVIPAQVNLNVTKIKS